MQKLNEKKKKSVWDCITQLYNDIVNALLSFIDNFIKQTGALKGLSPQLRATVFAYKTFPHDSLRTVNTEGKITST